MSICSQTSSIRLGVPFVIRKGSPEMCSRDRERVKISLLALLLQLLGLQTHLHVIIPIVARKSWW